MRTGTTSVVESRFGAMGTDVQITVVSGSARHLDLAARTISELERRWSRFLPESEISALNRRAGHPVLVSQATYELVARSVTGWHLTDGRFDPTVGASVVAHGYDRDFAELRLCRPEVGPTEPAPTPAGIDLAPEMGTIALPPAVVFDPGGIGKGLAADRTAACLLDAGSHGALVNIGGDLRAVGRPPTEEGWVVTVPDPIAPGGELLRIAIPDGAVATSSTLRRRWTTTTGEVHHLIDPATGRPAVGDIASVTVVAGEAWWAEVLTKSVLLSGPSSLASLDDAHAVVVMRDGTRHATAGIRGALR
jgi:thiamine biosynthesis lipoprotein